MLYRFGLSLIVVLFLVVSSVEAATGAGTKAMDFVRLGQSVKGASMGGSLTAYQGLAGLTYNPASVSGLSSREYAVQYMGYFEDMAYQTVNLVQPLFFGTLAFHVGRMDYGSQLRTTVADPSGDSGDRFSNSGLQVLGAYGASYYGLDLGVALRYLSETLDSETATALGLDLGLRYQMTDSLSFAASVTSLTLKQAKFITEDAPLSHSYRGGVLYRTSWLDNPIEVSADLVFADDHGIYYGVGIQYVLYHILSIRAGGTTFGEFGHVSLGLGLDLAPVNLDFSYQPSHLLGSSYRIGVGFQL